MSSVSLSVDWISSVKSQGDEIPIKSQEDECPIIVLIFTLIENRDLLTMDLEVAQLESKLHKVELNVA